jgi:hypothetical protein
LVVQVTHSDFNPGSLPDVFHVGQPVVSHIDEHPGRVLDDREHIEIPAGGQRKRQVAGRRDRGIGRNQLHGLLLGADGSAVLEHVHVVQAEQTDRAEDRCDGH